MRTLLQDLRYGIRMLVKKPGFTAAAVLTLAIGIGANTAMFSVINAVLLEPLPYAEPDQLVYFRQFFPSHNQHATLGPDFLDWREQKHLFEHVAAYADGNFNLTGMEQPERINGLSVSAGFFPLLGVKPMIGRTFTPDEDQPGAERVLLLSYSLWQRRFGGEQNLVGRPIALDGKSFTVVGILPQDFQFYDLHSDVVVPLALDPVREQREPLNVSLVRAIGRLKSGVSREQAEADLQVLGRQLGLRYPEIYSGVRVDLIPRSISRMPRTGDIGL